MLDNLRVYFLSNKKLLGMIRNQDFLSNDYDFQEMATTISAQRGAKKNIERIIGKMNPKEISNAFNNAKKRLNLKEETLQEFLRNHELTPVRVVTALRGNKEVMKRFIEKASGQPTTVRDQETIEHYKKILNELLTEIVGTAARKGILNKKPGERKGKPPETRRRK